MTYLDLKKFKFYYWFAFPALKGPKATFTSCPKRITECLNTDQLSSLETKHKSIDPNHASYFLILLQDDHEVTLHPVEDFSTIKESGAKVYIGFADPSTHSEYPGWPLRNFLSYINAKFPGETEWNVLCFRVKSRNPEASICFSIRVASSDDGKTTVGWEKNDKDKLVPRVVDLSHVLDPAKLAQNAVNLNLKLMRWRLVPDLDLDKVAATKVLILGSGTLGCNVARGLLAWGVSNITFVDNSKVSYSNPVRQSLFEFQDCLKSGKDKSAAAAEALKRIYPKVNSRGLQLSIPMPGHSVPDSSKFKQEVTDHKLIFFLF